VSLSIVGLEPLSTTLLSSRRTNRLYHSTSAFLINLSRFITSKQQILLLIRTNLKVHRSLQLRVFGEETGESAQVEVRSAGARRVGKGTL
jgi:hypothetical protein